MLKRYRLFLICCAILTADMVPAAAQVGPDIPISPGDKVTWFDPNNTGAHAVLFGVGVLLTPLDSVDKVFAFSPPLTVGTDGGGRSEILSSVVKGTLVGTVKDDALTAGIATVNFTCDIHRGQMRSRPFRVEVRTPGQPLRDIRIKPATVGNNWVMTTPAGDVVIDAP